MIKQNYYQVINVIAEVFAHLPYKRKKQFVVLLTGMIFVAFLEIAAAGALAFFGAALISPEKILQSSYISKFQSISGIYIFEDFNNFLIIFSSLLVLLIALKNLIQGIITYYSTLYSNYCGNYLGETLLNGFLYLPYEWHLSKTSADLIQAVGWRQQFSTFIHALLKTLGDVFIVTVLLMSILLVKPSISIPLIAILGLIGYFFFFRFRKYLDKVSEKLRNYRLAINRHIHKTLYGLKDIRVCGRENLFYRIFRSQIHTEARLNSVQQVSIQIPGWFLEVFSVFLVCCLICIFFLVLKTSSVWGLGYIIFLAVVARRATPKISQIIQSLSQLRINLPYITYDLEYLNIIKKMNLKQSNIKNINPFAFQKSLQLFHISFNYNGTDVNVLEDVSFNIRKGETIGIVGISGAGKSTLIDLIIGLLQPKSGKLMIDGKIPDDRLIRAWMRNIGYVPQDPYICVGNIAENIAFGYTGDEIDRERVIECCRMASMDDFLWDLPEGIDTQIGQRGVRLSGGQRQRVSIARALYHAPEVLIFDEATSSLDTKSEKAIQKTIYSFKGKQTLIIIAHRLSTVEGCDKVIWLEKGCIKSIGSPHEILPEYEASMMAIASAI